MNAPMLALLALLAFGTACFLYAPLLSRKVLELDPSRPTPASEVNDGVDYVPTRPSILFGHHFASISGLGPLLGPAIGVVWGWLPALLWIVLGSIFAGAVHDFVTLVISVRHGGRSIGDVTRELIGQRARLLFLLLIFFILSLAMGVFAYVVAQIFSEVKPEAVIPTWSLIAIAILMGLSIYKARAPLGPVTAIGVAATLFTIWLGFKFPVRGLTLQAWVYILLAYAYMASALPVWLLLQPRDYVNSFALYLSLLLLYLGMFVGTPKVVAPALNRYAADLPPLFPLLFVVVACGAISGFHSLVSSGTSAKQLASERDAPIIGYGGMLVEGALAAAALLACAAGFATKSEWLSHYGSWGLAKGAPLKAFIGGAASIVSKLGIQKGFAATLIAVIAVGFAMTTLDTATRLLRYNVEELAATLRIRPLRNRWLASVVAVGAIGFFALVKVGGKPAGMLLWPLFGSTNQLLAGLALLVGTVYLVLRGKNPAFTGLPMAFMLVATISAIFVNLKTFAAKGATALVVVSVIVLLLALWLVVEAAISLARRPKAKERGGRP